MNVTNIGIGMLFSTVAFHVALVVCIAAWHYNFNANHDFTPVNAECANPTYAKINQRICSLPSWAHNTPLQRTVEALPEEGSFTFVQMITMTTAIIIAIIHLLYLNHAILYSVDPFLEVIVTIARIASIISIILLLLTAGRSLAGGVAGTLARRF